MSIIKDIKIKTKDNIESLQKTFNEFATLEKIYYLTMNNICSVDYKVYDKDDVESLIKKVSLSIILKSNDDAIEAFLKSVISFDLTFLDKNKLNLTTKVDLILKYFRAEHLIIAEIQFINLKNITYCNAEVNLEKFFENIEFKEIYETIRNIVVVGVENSTKELSKRLQILETENKKLIDKVSFLESENNKLKNEIYEIEQKYKSLNEKLNMIRELIFEQDYENYE
jgi:vacuolar-type H+-ATPase subunit I/STV1